MSTNDTAIVTFLMAMASVPIIAFVANAMLTLRDSSLPGTPGLAEINLGLLAMIPVFVVHFSFKPMQPFWNQLDQWDYPGQLKR